MAAGNSKPKIFQTAKSRRRTSRLKHRAAGSAMRRYGSRGKKSRR